MAGEKLIASNPKAKSNYFIEGVIEAGIALTGTEIKSLRIATPNIKESYVDIRSDPKGQFQAFWVQATIPEYPNGNRWNHEPTRERRLLMHRREIDRLYGQVNQKGKTLIALRLYLKNGKAKLEVGLGKGKKKHDKRETIKQKSADLEMKRALKRQR